MTFSKNDAPLLIVMGQSNAHAHATRLPEDEISTHSFRKLYAMKMYEASGHDIHLVSKLLQHSSIACTQRYLGLVEDDLKDFSSSIYI